jgi:hypothetical protein
MPPARLRSLCRTHYAEVATAPYWCAISMREIGGQEKLGVRSWIISPLIVNYRRCRKEFGDAP